MPAYVVAQAVEGAGTHTDLIDALERGRARARRVMWQLAQGADPIDRILYQVDSDTGV